MNRMNSRNVCNHHDSNINIDSGIINTIAIICTTRLDRASEDLGRSTGHAQRRDQPAARSTLASADRRRTAAVHRRGGAAAPTSPAAVPGLQVPAAQESLASRRRRRPTSGRRDDEETASTSVHRSTTARQHSRRVHTRSVLTVDDI